MGVSVRQRNVFSARGTIAGLTSALLLAVGTGCGSDTPVPSPLEDDPGSGSVANQAPDDRPEPTPTEDEVVDDATPTPLDVCALVGAERVQRLFDRNTPPDVDRPESDQFGGAIPGVGEISYCTYRWEQTETSDQVRVSVMSDIEISDAGQFVDAALGPEHDELAGAGDAAGIEREGQFGHGLASATAAQQTDAGMVAVTILAPVNSSDDAFAGLATEFFAHAADF